jgi:hypothetical protein
MQTENNNSNSSDNTDDLAARLRSATETKSPEQTVSVNDGFWDQEAEIEEETAEEAASAPKSKSREQEIKDSGDTAAVGQELLVTMLCDGIIGIRHRNKFTPEENEKLKQGLIDADAEVLQGDQKTLRAKWDRLQKQREKKKRDIQYTADQRQRMQRAWQEYFRITGKKLSPEWLIVISLFEGAIKKGFDAFTD